MYLTDERREDNQSKFPIPLSSSLFTEAELLAAEKWRNTYLAYMRSLEDSDISDERCEAAKSDYMRGIKILEAQDLSKKPYCKRKRVLHAVNAVCVYGEPEELGDRDFILAAAKVGLADLARNF
jgi:hypothetical protein